MARTLQQRAAMRSAVERRILGAPKQDAQQSVTTTQPIAGPQLAGSKEAPKIQTATTTLIKPLTLPGFSPEETSTIQNRIDVEQQQYQERLQRNSGLVDAINGWAKQTAFTAYNKYIKPLAGSISRGQVDVVGSALEGTKEYAKEVITNPMQATDKAIKSLYGSAIGAVEGMSLGWVPIPEKLKPRDEYGEQSEKIMEFVSYMIPYETTERILASGAAKIVQKEATRLGLKTAEEISAKAATGGMKFMPGMIINNPRVVRSVINVASFMGTSQLSKDAFTLTKEEQDAGLTHFDKRMNILASDAMLLMFFKGLGFVRKGLGKGLGASKKEAENIITKDSIKEFERAAKETQDAIAHEKMKVDAAKIHNEYFEQTKERRHRYRNASEAERVKAILTHIPEGSGRELAFSLAYSDRQTGVMNKAFFEESGANRRPHVLMDVDNFKSINSNFSHEAGDVAIQKFADTLEKYFPHRVFHVGGDEFAVDIDLLPRESVISALNLANKDFKRIVIDSGDKGKFSGLSFTAAFGTDFRDASERLVKQKAIIKQNIKAGIEDDIAQHTLVDETLYAQYIKPKEILELSPEVASAVVHGEKMLSAGGEAARNSVEARRIQEFAKVGKEKIDVNYLKEKFLQTADATVDGKPIENFEDVLKEYYTMKTGEPVSFGMPEASKEALESLSADALLQQTQRPLSDVFEKRGYKRLVDIELESIGESSPLFAETAEGKILSSSELEGRLSMGKPVSYEAVSGFAFDAADVSTTEKIKQILYDEFVADTVTGFKYGARATYEQKSVAKKLASYIIDDKEELKKSLDYIESLSGANETLAFVNSQLNELSANVYKQMSNGGMDALRGAKFVVRDTEKLQKILNLFKKTDGSYESLAASVLKASGKAQAGASPFNTANKLIKEVGFVDMKDFATRVQNQTGITLVDETGRGIITERKKAINDFNKYAKENGYKNGQDMVSDWVKNSTLSMDERTEIKSQKIHALFGDDFQELELANLHNSVEATESLRKEMEAGFVRIPTMGSDVISDNAAIEQLFSDKQSVVKAMSDWVGSARKSVNDLVKFLFAAPERDERIIKNFPEFVTKKYQLQGQVKTAFEAGIDVVANITKDLNDVTSHETFRRSAVLLDLYATGMEGKTLPLGLTTEDVLRELKTLKGTLDDTPKIREALLRHARITRAMKNSLEKMESLESLDITRDLTEANRDTLESFIKDFTGIPNATAEDFYFPHKIIDYYTDKLGAYPWFPSKLRKPFRPYLKERGGSLRDIITNYENVMQNYVSNVLADASLEKGYADLTKSYSLNPKLMETEEGRQILSGRAPNRVIPAEMMPEEVRKQLPGVEAYKWYAPENGRNFYKARTVDEKLLQQAMEDQMSVADWQEMTGPRGGKPVRDALVLGSRKEMFLVPEEIHSALNKMRTPIDKATRVITAPFKTFNQWWKPTVTKWFGGSTWRLTNSIMGDTPRMLLADPGAITEASRAAQLAYQIAFSKKPEEQWARDFMQDCYRYDITRSSFLSQEVGISAKRQSSIAGTGLFGVFDLIKNANEKYNQASAMSELMPRLAPILHNLKRNAEGLAPILNGAPEYVLNMAKKGFIKEAIFEYGNVITGNYHAMPADFRAWFSDAFAPFAFWFVDNARFMKDLTKQKPMRMLGVATAWYAGTTVWNNTSWRKKYEDGMTELQRWSPHLWVAETGEGLNTKGVYVPLVDPITNGLRVFGGDRAVGIIESVATKRLSPEDAAWKLANTALTGPVPFIQGLISPFIQVFEGLVTNTDPFTKKKIVDSTVSGDPKTAFQKQLAWVVPKLFTPVYYGINAAESIDPDASLAQWGWEAFGKAIVPRMSRDMPLQEAYLKAEQQAASEAESKATVFHQDFRNSFFEYMTTGKDKDKLQEMMGQLESGEAPTNVVALSQYLNNDSTKMALMQMMTKKQTDVQTRERMQQILSLMQRLTLFKSTPSQLRSTIYGE